MQVGCSTMVYKSVCTGVCTWVDKKVKCSSMLHYCISPPSVLYRMTSSSIEYAGVL